MHNDAMMFIDENLGVFENEGLYWRRVSLRILPHRPPQLFLSCAASAEMDPQLLRAQIVSLLFPLPHLRRSQLRSVCALASCHHYP